MLYPPKFFATKNLGGYTRIMFWGDKIVQQIEKVYAKKIAAKKPLIIRDEKTISGEVHVGSLRGVAIHGLIHELLKEKGIKSKYLFELNDYDPFDDIPNYVDQKKYKKELGKLLNQVPAPDGKTKNWAEYFIPNFTAAIKKTDFAPTYYRSSEVYGKGKYDKYVETALAHEDEIRSIYKRIADSDKEAGWLKETVKKNGKLPWKIEWAAKFAVFNVDIEGGGKDHSTKGGSREVSNAISREIFNYQPPFDIPYNFFVISGKKMSSSKGLGVSAFELAELLPTPLLRLLLIQKQPKHELDFDPTGDTIPNLYDEYDRLADIYFSGKKDDFARLFELIHPKRKIVKRFLPRFSQIAYLSQMPHIDLKEEAQNMKDGKLTKDDLAELRLRKEHAQLWLEKYGPDKYQLNIQSELPETAKTFNPKIKSALARLLDYVEKQKKLDGQELHYELHEIRKSSGLEPQEFFSSLYTIILDKDSGPKAGWFFSVLDKKFLEGRLKETIK